jgi:hypothetical protein
VKYVTMALALLVLHSSVLCLSVEASSGTEVSPTTIEGQKGCRNDVSQAADSGSPASSCVMSRLWVKLLETLKSTCATFCPSLVPLFDIHPAERNSAFKVEELSPGNQELLTPEEPSSPPIPVLDETDRNSGVKKENGGIWVADK